MRRLFSVALLIGLAVAFVLSVSLGSVRIPISGVLAVLFGSEVERETCARSFGNSVCPKR
jgi:ABC-type Fe3+-siderophore transport system permease subunit